MPTAPCCPSSWRAILRAAGFCSIGPRSFPTSRLLAERGLADRIDVVAGDFFEAVPPADIYIVSRVLHDWDDQSSLRLLANMAAAARGELEGEA